MIQRAFRIAVRTFGIGSVLGLTLVASPAFADTPVGWATAPGQSFWQYLVLLLLIPGGLALTITALTMLPSLVKRDRYDPAKAWPGMQSGGSDWFGGPAKGTDQPAAPKAEGSGGAGASW